MVDYTEEELDDWPCHCPECGKDVMHSDMSWTFDCHGIAFRKLCQDCWRQAMAKGYDGEYYDESDECLDYEY